MARRKTRELSRKKPEREPYELVLIVCEGTKTENFYFKNLIYFERLSSVNVTVVSGNGSAPISVVETACEIMKEKNFDKVYCVIDRDEHPTFDNAKRKAEGNQIELVVSYPSFEYWYLCHFRFTRSPIIRSSGKSPGDNCVAMLNTEWNKAFSSDYEKNIKDIYHKLNDRLETALKHAKQAQEDADKNSELNPSTQVYQLVEFLRNIKKS